jgi:outer membrane lipoprotein-sorting protein
VAPAPRGSKRVTLLVAAAVVVSLLGGCAMRRPRPAASATPDELLDILAARRAAVTSLRARMRLKAGLRAAWTRQALLVRRPDAIRIDVLSPFGLALAIAAHDDTLWAFPPSEGTRYEGAATPENLSRFLGAPIAVPDVVDLLLGVPPARTPVGRADVSRNDAGELALTLPLRDGVQTIWFAGVPPVVVRAEERYGSGVALAATFTEYENGFPHAVDVASPASGTEARLRYDSVEPNAAIDPALFAPPPAARVLPLDAAGSAPR